MLQFVFGPSGAGKSYKMYKKIIEESIENPGTNYILLVPEQYSMALQRKMVKLHPNKGTLNIDVIGFNRLAYRVFDELSVKPAKVLEDFGKTMLIRQVAGAHAAELELYGGCLDKNGFIDEVKSLMSELYQYDIQRDRLRLAMEKLDGGSDELLRKKLSDMQVIFEAFDEKIKDEYIVAEQLTELLAEKLEESALIKNSVIVMDGFTGFTPIQLKVIAGLLRNSRGVYVILDYDKQAYEKQELLQEHELFYLTSQTVDALKKLAESCSVKLAPDIFVSLTEEGRWDAAHADIRALEKNIFRYPYTKYKEKPENIKLYVCDNPKAEIKNTASVIRQLVTKEGYRYKDIAVISGNLESIELNIRQIFSLYDIPYFIDMNQPVKNNPFVNAIGYAIELVKDKMSYNSVFAFLKSGVFDEISTDEIEQLENYCIARGVRGISWWKREFKSDVETTRAYVMEIIGPFYQVMAGGRKKVSVYVEAINGLMEALGFKERMGDEDKLYENILKILDKLSLIMADDELDVDEFSEIFDVGLKELSVGRIPSTLDMLIVGDITRTRLDDVKVLFVMGVNDGIIPKKGSSTQIISDNDKGRLKELGLTLAPSEKTNAFIEQFYLYINMTKPSDKLFVSYSELTDAGDAMRKSYIIGRILNIFPALTEEKISTRKGIGTRKSELQTLVEGIRQLMDGDYSHVEETKSLYQVYRDYGEGRLEGISEAINYNNIPKPLRAEVAKLVRLKLVNQSVSRLERFANCAYSYFLMYTLGLKERQTNEIDNRDVGNILHEAMEKMYRHVHDNMNNDWKALSADESDRLITQFVEQSFDEIYEDEGKNAYIRSTLARIGRRTMRVMNSVTERDGLSPEFFEYKFKKPIQLGEDDYVMNLSGIVDRGDLFYSQSENKLKLRIIDYKSGSQEFDISRLYEGLQLQLAVYMNVMHELVESRYDMPDENTKLVSEGMYYYHMQDPMVEADSETQAEKLRDKKLDIKGLSNKEDGVLDNVVRYSMLKAKELSLRILSGEISKNPKKTAQPPCDYCKYRMVCRFDAKSGNNKYSYPRFKKTDRERVYEEILKKLDEEENKNGMD